MTRPGNKLLQFACSKERGKAERVGDPAANRLPLPSDRGDGSLKAEAMVQVSSLSAIPADSLWSTSHFNFHHKRPNGTFVNGPEAMDSIARGVILTVLLAALVGMGFWLCWGFSQAENAIIHRLGK